MIVRRAVPDLTITSTNIAWRWSRLVRASSSAMPMTPFIGVRISWLILARNSDFVRSADCAFIFSAASEMLALCRSWCALEMRRIIGSKMRSASRRLALTMATATPKRPHWRVPWLSIIPALSRSEMRLSSGRTCVLASVCNCLKTRRAVAFS